MFFGKKLKELRLKYTKMGLRKFAKEIEISTSELSKIERGIISPPTNKKWLHKILLFLKLEPESLDYIELRELWNKPFTKQKITEEGVVLFSNNKDIEKLSKYINSTAIKHNKRIRKNNG